MMTRSIKLLELRGDNTQYDPRRIYRKERKGGFYRLNKDGGKKVKEARNLHRVSKCKPKSRFPSAKMGKRGISSLMDCNDDGARLVTEVLLDSLSMPT